MTKIEMLIKAEAYLTAVERSNTNVFEYWKAVSLATGEIRQFLEGSVSDTCRAELTQLIEDLWISFHGSK